MDPKQHQKESGTDEKLARMDKSLVVDPERSQYIDKAVIQRRYLNALNHSMLTDDFKKVQLTIGVTSPNKGEGKTLTAANLAVSLALAYKKRTVLVDLNMNNPCLHKVFGTKLNPGLVESFHNGSIFLSRTKLDQLYLLPAGKFYDYSLGLESIVPIRNIINGLRKEFEFIILDMNSVLPIDDFPVVCVNEVDGLLMVLDTQKTKYADVEKIFKHIKEEQTLGFIFNNTKE